MVLPAVPELDPVCFTDEQVAAIFDHLERDKTSGNLRLRAMANITLDNGARPAEVVGIRLCDVTYKPREVRIMGKAQRERYVPLGQKSLEFIDDYLRVRPHPPMTATSSCSSTFESWQGRRASSAGQVPQACPRGGSGPWPRRRTIRTTPTTLRKTFARRAA